jgi:hypothetical protein
MASSGGGVRFESGLVGADRWRVGLLRLGAQKEKREQERRLGTVLRGGYEVRAEKHAATLTLGRGRLQVTGV